MIDIFGWGVSIAGRILAYNGGKGRGEGLVPRIWLLLFAAYTDQKDQNKLRYAAALAGLCALLSLLLLMHGLSTSRSIVWLDTMLLPGFALELRITKRRLWAFLLLFYTGIRAAVTAVLFVQLIGWWAIPLGIWAVGIVSRLHKSRQKLPQGSPHSWQREDKEMRVKADSKRVFATVLPFIGMVLGILIIWFSISPSFLNLLVGNAKSPEALLRGYRNWYSAILGAVAVSTLPPSVGVVISALKGLRTSGAILLMPLALGFPIFLGGAMVGSENIPALLNRAHADMAQLESGQLQEAIVWLTPNGRPSRLPGPYGEGQPEPVTLYRGIGAGTDVMWADFYLPNCLHFSPDPDAPYRENESISWNREHARQYLIRYTENFRLAVSVEPVADAGAGQAAQSWEFPAEG